MKIFRIFALSLLILCSGIAGMGQAITSTPVIPTVNDEITVRFDISKCTRQDLLNYTGDVYVHTGVFVEGISNWAHVIAQWGDNIAKAKCTRINTNVYEIKITPDVTGYYGISAGETVTSLNFVVRSSDGTKQTEDLFLPVYQSGLTMEISNPSTNLILSEGDTLNIKAKSIYLGTTAPTAISLLIDNTLKYTSASDTLSHKIIVNGSGNHWIKVTGTSGSYSAADSISYFVKKQIADQELPSGVTDGINYIDSTTVTLVLYAPGKQSAFAIGDFNDWQLDTTYQMRHTPDGNYWWITVKNIVPKEEYAFQYLIDGNLRIADPYTEKVLDPTYDKDIPSTTYPNLKAYPTGKTTEIAGILQTDQPKYQWKVTDFQAPADEDLVIYETHVENFTKAGNINALKDTLNYLKTLGVNAVELMPVNEFEGNDSWGYNPSFYFAFDKAYGTSDDYKAFIDACHENGMAVIMDIALNHSFGQSPLVRLYQDSQNNRPAADNPWFNPIPKHEYNVGYDMNHESLQTKKYCSRIMKFWLEKYHIDGYRFDLAKGFTQKNTLGNVAAWGHYDSSRVAIWGQYADSIKSVKPNTYMILEYFADNDEETVLANEGFMLWGNLNAAYNQATMSYNDAGGSWDFSWISYKKRGWNDPNLVGYMESHDEERLMYKNEQYGNSNSQYNVKDTATGLQRIETAGAFFFTVPGPKMIWEWGELGYDYSINRCTDGTISNNCRTSLKPVRWDYYQDASRYRLYKAFEALIKFKETDICRTTDYTIDFAKALKSVHLNSANENATIIGNFGISNGNIVPNFQHTGTWYDYMTGKSIDVSATNAEITLRPGEYHIYTDVEHTVPDLPAATEWPNVTSTNFTANNTTIKVYPNPVTGNKLNISCASGGDKPVRVSLYSTSGQLLLYNNIFPSATDGNFSIDLSKCHQQVIIYKITTNQQNFEGRVVVY